MLGSIAEDGAEEKQITVFITFRSGSGSNEALFFTKDFSVFKHSRQPTENEVGGALEVVVFVVLANFVSVCIQGCPETLRTGSFKYDPVGIYPYRYRLSNRSGGVFEGDISGRKVTAEHKKAGRTGGAHFFT